MRQHVIHRAQAMCRPSAKAVYLCPLNVDDRCILYPYRTMICRLHGLPYEVRRPDGKTEEGPGCDRFERERTRRGLVYRRIDRTPLYNDLARLEWQIRQANPRHPSRFKRTIAQMIRDGGGGVGEPFSGGGSYEDVVK
jgi:hypothetical protein